MRIVLWVLLGLFLVLLAAVVAAVIRTLLAEKKTASYRPDPPAERAEALAEKLAAMVRCETETDLEGKFPGKFERFHRELEYLFPLVHEKLEKTVIDHDLLIAWPGKRHDKPIVLMAHQDVVPAEGEW